MKKRKLGAALLIVTLLLTSSVYAQKPVELPQKSNVSMIDKGDYFEVTLDLKKAKSHRDIGKAYAKEILKNVSDYEAIIDSYLAEMTGSDEMYNVLMGRVNDIKPKINKEYRDEIEGMGSQMSAENTFARGDGKLSINEMYILNLFPDIARGTQCSALAVYGKRSQTNNTMAARILDWTIGSKNQLAKIQCVMTIKNGQKSICTIGYLGFMGVITGLNDDKVFAAILDSKTGQQYTSASKNSYPFDIRFALENESTLNGVASYMKSQKRDYTFGHLIFLSDPKTAAVLENNISGTSDSLREVRTEKSILNKGIEWGIDNSIGTVNSFMLKGNFDNHSNYIINTKRWDNLKKHLTSKADVVTLDELIQVITFHNGATGIGDQAEGSLYNDRTQQIVLFEPRNLNLKVFFRPKDGVLPNNPEFNTIKVKF